MRGPAFPERDFSVENIRIRDPSTGGKLHGKSTSNLLDYSKKMHSKGRKILSLGKFKTAL